MNNQDTHESIRVKLWCDVYTAIAAADNITKDAPVRFANAALKDFDEKFPFTKKEETQCGRFVHSGDKPIDGMMCKPQSAQINCLAESCYYNQGAGYCSHPAPEFNVVGYKDALPMSTCRSYKENID